ncbi:MAG: tRNA (adenosine(37)-N6)-dimethylallyltransferase MiaA [Myxococcota bacterium]|nr:tRNA (adenosine(37)-N6)-dimethylallyltransferase MiaA [Myxococcota bacterium]
MVSPRLIVVQGATASGKSELALQLAEALGAEIIGADSRQVVEGMVIGTAAPSVDEKARIPHHMIGCWKPGDEVSAGRWLRTVEDLLEGRPDQPFVVVGGTALWVRLLLQGAISVEPIPAEIRAEVAALDETTLREQLKKVDPQASASIHPNDRYRLERALGHFKASGKALGAKRAEHDWGEPRYPSVRLALMPPRDWLHDRIECRAAAMFGEGLVEEAVGLRARYGKVRPLDAIGYRQALAVADGTLDEGTAIALTARDTRRYARNQETWLRKEPVTAITVTDGEGRLERAQEILQAAS